MALIRTDRDADVTDYGAELTAHAELLEREAAEREGRMAARVMRGIGLFYVVVCAVSLVAAVRYAAHILWSTP